MEISYTGIVAEGFGFASGRARGAASPFSAGTLTLQAPHFAARGLDLAALVPGLRWGTINIRLSAPLRLVAPDWTLRGVDWTVGEPDPAARIAPEDFSFLRCRLRIEGAEVSGLIYHPHPETKPDLNAHDPHVVEVIAPPIAALRPGAPAALIVRKDAYAAF